MAYTITLTEEDTKTIDFIGSRYLWSEACSVLDVGVNELTESEAWELSEAINEDLEDHRGMLPLLSPSSSLYTKLIDFIDSIA